MSLWFFLWYRLTAKKRLILTLTTSLAFLLSAATFNNTTIASANSIAQSSIASPVASFTVSAQASSKEKAAESMLSVERYVKNYFSDTPILAKIAECESRYRQFESDGSVFRGKIVYEDVGVMQVNETYHKVDAKKFGFDIYTLDGNLAYAKYIYDKQGTQPWSASKACWNK